MSSIKDNQLIESGKFLVCLFFLLIYLCFHPTCLNICKNMGKVFFLNSRISFCFGYENNPAIINHNFTSYRLKETMDLGFL